MIGGATVRRLISDGAAVIAAGRSVEKLNELELETGALPLPFDLTSKDSVRGAVEDLEL